MAIKLFIVWISILISSIALASLYFLWDANFKTPVSAKDLNAQNFYSHLYMMICYGGILLFSISTLTIFLNAISWVQEDKLWRAASFFILPVVIFLIFTFRNGASDFKKLLPFLLPIYIPFFLSLAAGYLIFEKNKRKILSEFY